MLVLKNVLFTLLVPGTVTVVLPYLILSRKGALPALEWGVRQYLGLLPIAAGAAVYFWCLCDFAAFGRGTPAPIDAPKKLVVRGLYRYVRNPMYLGVFLVILGEAEIYESAVLFQYGLACLVFFPTFIVLYEEPALRRRFGEPYERYRREVRRWLPGKYREWSRPPYRKWRGRVEPGPGRRAMRR